MNKSKILTIAVVLLVIFNLMTLTALYLGRPQGPLSSPQGPKNIIVERLNFDDSQKEAYDAIITKHQQLINEKDVLILDAKNELYKTLIDGNTADKDSLLALLANVQSDIEAIHLQHFDDVKSICHEDQMDDFNLLVEEISQLFSQRPAPPQ